MTSIEKAFVKLNVGRTVFETRLETLGRGSKQGSQVNKIILKHVLTPFDKYPS
jgi:hypothetical protein